MAIFGNLFGRMYSKEGPGVSKDDPQRPAFTRYFSQFFGKFGKWIQLNLLFLIPTAVVAVAMFFLYTISFTVIFTIGNTLVQVDLWHRYVFPLPLIFWYPFLAGVTMISRSAIREEPFFVFTDAMNAIKKNFKIFFLNGIIIYVVYILFSLSFDFYFYLMFQHYLLIIPFILSCIVIFLFIAAQFYIPMMAITFKLRLRDLYRNGLIFGIIGFPRNLLILFLILLIIFYFFFIYTMMLLFQLLAVLFFLTFGFVFNTYTKNFIIYPVIEKYLINGETETNRDKRERIREEREQERNMAVLSEEEFNALSEIKSEYVYVNGKLIKRSEYEAQNLDDDT